jgi:hypothetical protein
MTIRQAKLNSCPVFNSSAFNGAAVSCRRPGRCGHETNYSVERASSLLGVRTMRVPVARLLLTVCCLLASSVATAQPYDSQVGKPHVEATPVKVKNPFSQDSQQSKVVDYVERMLRDHDVNRDGSLDAAEWKTVTWNKDAPPETSDANGDGKLSKAELINRIAKRFNIEFPIAADAAVPAESKRKQISFEVTMIERPVAEGDAAKLPTAEQLLKLDKSASVQRLKLVAVENVESRLMLGEDAPMVTGRSSRGPGFPGQESVTYTSIGTTLTVTAEVEASGNILASIQLQRTSLPPVKAAEKEGEATPNVYPRKTMTTINTTARIAAGEPLVISGQQTTTGTAPSELWVVVTAKVQ